MTNTSRIRPLAIARHVDSARQVLDQRLGAGDGDAVGARCPHDGTTDGIDLERIARLRVADVAAAEAPEATPDDYPTPAEAPR